MQKAKDVLFRQRWALTAAALGAVTFLLIYGTRVLDPTNIDWLHGHGIDPFGQYLGWSFFRQSPWRLPYIGMNYNLLYPHRISIVFTDGLPLFALPFKLLSPLLPEPFQYFGLWGLLCFALQGFLGQKCIARVGGASDSVLKNAASLLGAQALVLFPVLTVRMFNHTALAGNWLILAALYLWLRAGDPALTTRKACLWWGVMGFLCVTVMMYYVPMIGIVLVGFAVRRAQLHRSPADVLLPIPIFCGVGVFCLFILGAFSGNMAAPSVGKLSGADFLNLVIPGLYSSWEYNLYIGTGLVLAVVLAVLSLLAAALLRPRWLQRVPASAWHWAVSVGVILLLTFVACSSNTVTLGGHTLGTVPLPAPLMRFWSMFVNCGRIGWVAGYLLAVLACGLLLRFWRPGISTVLLAVCLAVQTVSRLPDLSYVATTPFRLADAYVAENSLTDPGWQAVFEQDGIAHLQFASCNWDAPAFYPLCTVAAAQHWTINEFYISHADVNLMDTTVAGQMGELRSDTLYVFLGLDELRRPDYSLHYYRLDGILVGTVDPLPLPEAELSGLPQYELVPAATFVFDAGSNIAGQDNGGLTVYTGGISGPGMDLWPGVYEVTLQGSGFDHSYVYSGWVQRNSAYHPLEIVWMESSPEKLVFRSSIYEVAFGWQTAVHALDDCPVTVDRITVTRVG